MYEFFILLVLQKNEFLQWLASDMYVLNWNELINMQELENFLTTVNRWEYFIFYPEVCDKFHMDTCVFQVQIANYVWKFINKLSSFFCGF